MPARGAVNALIIRTRRREGFAMWRRAERLRCGRREGNATEHSASSDKRVPGGHRTAMRKSVASLILSSASVLVLSCAAHGAPLRASGGHMTKADFATFI